MSIGQVLCLDLEQTLVDNAQGHNPRPHLEGFLESVFKRFSAVVLFTAVSETDARDVLLLMAEEGQIPVVAAQMPIVNWPIGGAFYEGEGYGTGSYKDLRYVQDMYPDVALTEIFLVDDDKEWINPEQDGQWVPIAPWNGNTGDRKLLDINNLLWTFTKGRNRTLPEAKPRMESAPLRFGDDWPGFYIRGDNAVPLHNQWLLLKSQIENEHPAAMQDPLVAIPMAALAEFFGDLERSHISHWREETPSEPDKP